VKILKKVVYTKKSILPKKDKQYSKKKGMEYYSTKCKKYITFILKKVVYTKKSILSNVRNI